MLIGDSLGGIHLDGLVAMLELFMISLAGLFINIGSHWHACDGVYVYVHARRAYELYMYTIMCGRFIRMRVIMHMHTACKIRTADLFADHSIILNPEAEQRRQ